MTTGPQLTAAAITHLAGRSVTLRPSPRHGCCGGHALLPVAEIGDPDDPTDYVVVDVEEITCFVDPQLQAAVDGWTIDAVGFGRWRRLYLDGTQSLDPAPGTDDRRS